MKRQVYKLKNKGAGNYTGLTGSDLKLFVDETVESTNKELTEIIIAGENLISGDLVYLESDGKWWKADNLDVAKSSSELRIATTTIIADATGNSLIKGQFTTTGLTVGEIYHVGTDGGIIDTVPETEGIIERYVGTALTTTILEFNPDESYIEVTLINPITTPPGSLLRFDNSESSAYVSSTTSETIIDKSLSIPANTFVTDQRWDFLALMDRFINVGSCVLKLYTNTSLSTSGATLLGQYTIPASERRSPFKRTIVTKSGNVQVFNTSTSSINDDLGSNSISSVVVNFTIDRYIFLTATPSDSGDAIQSVSIQLLQR